MKVNFDGMRMRATEAMNKLAKKMIELDYLDPGFIELYNEAAQSVDLFNCIYGDGECVRDISDEIEVVKIEVVKIELALTGSAQCFGTGS